MTKNHAAGASLPETACILVPVILADSMDVVLYDGRAYAFFLQDLYQSTDKGGLSGVRKACYAQGGNMPVT
jgi:hypothetical protein